MAPHTSRHPITRRDALCKMGSGFGMLAFASLVSESVAHANGLFGPQGGLSAAGRIADPCARQARHLPVHERRLVAGR
jgi:hypothetical protein